MNTNINSDLNCLLINSEGIANTASNLTILLETILERVSDVQAEGIKNPSVVAAVNAIVCFAECALRSTDDLSLSNNESIKVIGKLIAGASK